MSNKRPADVRLYDIFNFKKSKTTVAGNVLAVRQTNSNEEPSTSSGNLCESESQQENKGFIAKIEAKEEVLDFTNNADIGLYMNQIIDDQMKYKLLTSPWLPDPSFQFPRSGKCHFKIKSSTKMYLP